MDDEKSGMPTLMEQHIGTVIQFVVVGLLGWTGISMVGLKSDVAVLRVQVEALQVVVKSSSDDRYLGADAARDHSVIRQEMAILERRVEKLEKDH